MLRNVRKKAGAVWPARFTPRSSFCFLLSLSLSVSFGVRARFPLLPSCSLARKSPVDRRRRGFLLRSPSFSAPRAILSYSRLLTTAAIFARQPLRRRATLRLRYSGRKEGRRGSLQLRRRSSSRYTNYLAHFTGVYAHRSPFTERQVRSCERAFYRRRLN